MLKTTQSKDAKSYLSDNLIDIKSTFGIDWSTVTWPDLRKPFYSALAARLYIHYATRSQSSIIPRDVASQAVTWRQYFRPSGTVDRFTTLAAQLDKGEHHCISVEL